MWVVPDRYTVRYCMAGILLIVRSPRLAPNKASHVKGNQRQVYVGIVATATSDESHSSEYLCDCGGR